MADPPTIVELAPERVGDFLALFDSAFSDNPEWAGCYCDFHDDNSGLPFHARQSTRHRAARTKRICSGRARGLLAYSGGIPVGWCNVAPRSEIQNLRDLPALSDDGTADPAIIVCFVVPPEHRGRGLARALVAAAIEASRRWEVPWLEAYPDRPGAASEAPTAAADAYRGPLPLFLSSGFRIVSDLGDRLVVRHDLGMS